MVMMLLIIIIMMAMLMLTLLMLMLSPSLGVSGCAGRALFVPFTGRLRRGTHRAALRLGLPVTIPHAGDG
jgi:hypothetical protein